MVSVPCRAANVGLILLLIVAWVDVCSAFSPQRPGFVGIVASLQQSDDKSASAHERPRPSPSPELIISRRAAVASTLPVLFLGIGKHANAASSVKETGLDKQSLRGDYDRYSADYEKLDGGPLANALGISNARAEMLSRARGDVLEVGIGTGLNLPGYRFAAQPGGKVQSLSGIDLSQGMLAQAQAKATAMGLGAAQLKLAVMDVEGLAFADASFDTVVDTYSLCVFTNPIAALKEMRRVCKKDGSILLLENAISGVGPIAAYQRATAPAVARLGGKGCFYDQDPVALAQAAGLTVTLDQPRS